MPVIEYISVILMYEKNQTFTNCQRVRKMDAEIERTGVIRGEDGK